MSGPKPYRVGAFIEHLIENGRWEAVHREIGLLSFHTEREARSAASELVQYAELVHDLDSE